MDEINLLCIDNSEEGKQSFGHLNFKKEGAATREQG